MMNKKRLIEQYESMLKFKSIQGDVAYNRVNCYTCPQCGHITKTIDVDRGVTPFYHKCENCNYLMATSSFYKDIAPEQKPTQEWYRPTLKEVIKWNRTAGMDGLIDHILNGGLDVRTIKKISNENNQAATI